MSTSVNFLLQAIKIISNENINDNELDMVYEFLISIENQELKNYHMTSTVITYPNDLELYIETVKRLIKIFEDKEKYEQCFELKKKYDESIFIIENDKHKV